LAILRSQDILFFIVFYWFLIVEKVINVLSLEGMSHAQSHHLTPLGGRLPLKREISTHWQAGWLLLYVRFMYEKV